MRGGIDLALEVRHAPLEHLGHRREVVGTVERTDAETAVVRAAWRARLEDDHRGDGVRAHQVGDVEALDANRNGFEFERPPQAVERLGAVLSAPLGFELVFLECELCVALGQLEDAPLLAALRGPDLHRTVALRRQRRDRRRRHGVLDDDLGRHRRGGVVVLQQELLDHLLMRPLALVRQVERLAVGEHAVTDLEDLGVGVGPGERYGDRVERPDRRVRNPLALEQRADGGEAVALDRRLLERLGVGRGLHPILELALDPLVVAAQELRNAVDAAAVLLARDVVDAGRSAALDVVIEARRAGSAAGLGAGAGAHEEDAAENLERVAHALGVRVRPEVGAFASVTLAREVDTWKVLVERYRDERVGLVVAQSDVKARAVLLDERLLCKQRLALAAEDDVLDRVGLRDHRVVAKRAAAPVGTEVRGDALADRDRLADVDHATARVAEQVDARLVGELAPLLGEIRHRPGLERRRAGQLRSVAAPELVRADQSANADCETAKLDEPAARRVPLLRSGEQHDDPDDRGIEDPAVPVAERVDVEAPIAIEPTNEVGEQRKYRHGQHRRGDTGRGLPAR